MTNTRLRADLALVGTAFIWGATFVVVKRALDDISSVLFLTLRFTLAAAMLAVYFRRGWVPKREHLVPGVLVGACLGVGYAFQTVGLVWWAHVWAWDMRSKPWASKPHHRQMRDF